MAAARIHRRFSPYLFVAPFVLTFSIFTIYPLIQSVRLAMHQTHGPTASVFVGFKNFLWLFKDPDFWTALRNTAVFAAGSLVTQIPAALGLALLLNRKDVRLRGFWRMIFFAPSLVGLAFIAILAGLIFEKNTGLLNVVLHAAFGFDREFPWLQLYVMPALLIAAFWMSVGFYMVYFLAALQNVSPDLIEAAMIDGAGPWQRFWHVTLPSIRPVATFVMLLCLIGSFQLFELPYLLLNNGPGPDNQGLTLVMYLFLKGFDQGDLGMASAVGWLLALILFVLALLQQRASGTAAGGG